MKTTFCTAAVIDAIITENYINGALSANASVFTGPWAHALFQGNYVDFFKRVFNLPTGDMVDVRVIGNIFDYCWSTIGTSAAAYLSSFTVIGNTWDNCTAAAALPLFTAEDGDMTGTSWRAIDAPSGINRSTITGNHFIGVDLPMRFGGTLGANVIETGNVFDNLVGTRVELVAGTNATALSSDQVLAWTPTLSGSGSAVGNGTLTGTFSRSGQVVTFTIRFFLGSTSTIGSDVTFPLPDFIRNMGITAMLNDATVAAYVGGVWPVTGGIRMMKGDLSAFVGTSNPFTWVAGDEITVQGSYGTA
jgi:hypothetical protein